uniref:Uncharacterized protein n=1 Tax=Arundo donax TaxID=35708 RepID=A0A0A9ET06_ARUDO
MWQRCNFVAKICEKVKRFAPSYEVLLRTD